MKAEILKDEEHENVHIMKSNSKGTDVNRSCLTSIKDIRYLIIWMFACPQPLVPRNTPFIGRRTLLELIIMSLFFIVFIAATSLNVGSENGGFVTEVVSAMTIVWSLRDLDIPGMMLGYSFDRALYFHKYIAITSIVCMIVHMIAAGINASGIALIVFFLLTSAIYAFKQKYFEIFYYLHIGFVFCIGFAALAHGAILLFVAFLIWGADIMLRYVFTIKATKCRATVLPGNITRLDIPKEAFKYEAGQYVFIMIPQISRLEFHPFSMSSSPHHDYICIHCRNGGDWTDRLYKTVDSSSEDKTMTLDCYIEGPYGSPSVNVGSEGYQAVLLISGGIGITPLQSIYGDLLHQDKTGPEEQRKRKVFFIWSVKDRATVQAMGDSRRELSFAGGLPLSFQPQAELRDSYNTYRDSIANKNPRRDHNNFLLKAVTITPPLKETDAFHEEYYLTSAKAPLGSEDEHYGRVFNGRPDMPSIFNRMQSFCLDEDIKRVAVLVCGPEAMVNEVVDLCVKLNGGEGGGGGGGRGGKEGGGGGGGGCGGLSSSSPQVRFDYHQEVFDF